MTHFQGGVKLRRNRGLPNKLRDTKNGQLFFSISNIQQKKKKQKTLKIPAKQGPMDIDAVFYLVIEYSVCV